MNTINFENYFKTKTYISKGKERKYTPAAIQKRISSLAEVEKEFDFDIDTIITDRNEVIKLLKAIRTLKLEDRNHTPLSNAVRHYYEYMTGHRIEKIF